MTCISILLTLSLHLGMEHGFNEVNPHIRCDVANSSFGAYYNSEKDINDMVVAGLTADEITTLIHSNTYCGLTALQHINNWKRI